MLEFEEIYTLLTALKIPVAYHHFNAPPGSVPYLVYYAEGYDPEFADDINYVNRIPLRIELYSATKDLDLEADLEELLTDAGLTFDKDEIWIESEQLYEIIYETEVF